MLQKLQLKPGIIKDVTEYTAEGGWYDGDKVRFRLGFPETIGGWQEYTSNEFRGSCRTLLQWVALDGTPYTALGTNLKLYVETGGTYYDITPIRRTVTLGANPFTTQSTSNGKLTVTDASNGAVLNDFVTFSGATAFDNYTTGMLNAEHQIVEILTANTYTIEISGVTSAGAGVSGGGGAVNAEYQINTGPDTQVFGTGWGSGTYGRGTWGSSTTAGVSTAQIRIWSLDNFGEDLVACVRGGGIYYWSEAGGTSARAVTIASLSGSNQAPTIGTGGIISEIDRHIVVMGANENGSATQNLLLVRWSNQEDALEWEARRDTTAGSYAISTGSQIIGAVRSRQETLIWTDVALHSMAFTGPPYTFGFNLLAEDVSLMGPNAMAEARNTVFWMDLNEFRMYNGSVSTIPCTVQSYVFDNLNFDQRFKVFGGTNSRFNEVWWFYPSQDSNEIDRYVIYNYVDQVWSIGTMDRRAWWDQSFSGFPIAAGEDKLYTHEYGQDNGQAAIEKYIEGADMDIADGENYAFIRRLIPDFEPLGTNDTGQLTHIIKRRNFPGQSYTTAATVTPMATTEQNFVRVRGRQFAMRFESDEQGFGWRLGSPRIDIQPDGRKS